MIQMFIAVWFGVIMSPTWLGKTYCFWQSCTQPLLGASRL